MSNIQKHLDNSTLYWQKCLLDSDRINIENDDILVKLEIHSDPNALSSNLVQKLFKTYKKNLSTFNKDGQFSKNQNDLDVIPILYAPIVGQSIVRGEKKKLLIPLII